LQQQPGGHHDAEEDGCDDDSSMLHTPFEAEWWLWCLAARRGTHMHLLLTCCC
jgi:hypothetical protein